MLGRRKTLAQPQVEMVEAGATEEDPDLARAGLGLFHIIEDVGVDALGVGELPGLHCCEGSLARPVVRSPLPVETPSDREVHTTSLKVRFYELDPYDHVNHTNYFAYCETARIEYLTELGWGLVDLKRLGMQIVVVSIKARFHVAARYGEELTIHTWIQEIGRVRAFWHQLITRGDELVATVEIESATTDLEGRPKRIPAEFIERVSGKNH
jgi:acyl-CoA thioester hydrolase